MQEGRSRRRKDRGKPDERRDQEGVREGPMAQRVPIFDSVVVGARIRSEAPPSAGTLHGESAIRPAQRNCKRARTDRGGILQAERGRWRPWLTQGR